MFPQSPAWEGCTGLYNKGSVLVGQMTQGHRFIRNKSKGLKSKQGRLYSQTVNPKGMLPDFAGFSFVFFPL